MSYPTEPSLRQLAALLAAIETGSLRKAGHALGLGQPALSAQLTALEGLVGARLLERRSTGVIATAEGRVVAGLARDVLDAAQLIVDRGRRARPEATGTRRDLMVRLGVSASIGPYLLPPVVAVLNRTAPGLRLMVREGSADGLAASLRDGHQDVILTQLPVQGPGLVTRSVLEEPLFIMLAVEHPLAAHDRIDPVFLRGETMLTLGPGFTLTRQAARLAAETGAELSDGYEGSSMDALRMMCAIGQGIALVPALYAASEVRPDGRVVTRPLAGRRLSRTLALAWRTTQGNPPEIDLLADAISQGVADLKWQ